MVYKIKVLTVSRILLLQLEWRVSENGTIQQTQLAGIVHWLEPQSGVAESLG